MEQNKLHKNFKLNNKSFSSEIELLAFTQEISTEIYQFLKDWFHVNDTILVKTSGSTGKPKSILLKKELMQNSAKITGHYFNLHQNTTALLCLPIHYIAGKMMLIRALTLGWHLDVSVSNSKPLDNINKRYDFSAMVPLQLENSLEKINLIKKIIVGGGEVSNSLHKKLQTISTEVFATYGMTETVTHIAVKKLNKYTSWQERLFMKSYHKKTFYETLPGVTIYKDQRNCLVIDAPNVTDDVIFTNDIVELISDKQFEWLGRIDNVVNSGGVKLHPEKIEEKLATILQNRFFVAGVKDEKLGEKLILLVEGSHREISLENINLSKFEIPKEIYYLENFIETESGKIQRNKTVGLLKLE